MQIGKAIRILRSAKGRKLNELAERAKVSNPYLSLVETGERQPSLDVLRRISVALDIPIELLILVGSETGDRLKTGDKVIKSVVDSLEKLADAEDALKRKLED